MREPVHQLGSGQSRGPEAGAGHPGGSQVGPVYLGRGEGGGWWAAIEEESVGKGLPATMTTRRRALPLTEWNGSLRVPSRGETSPKLTERLPLAARLRPGQAGPLLHCVTATQLGGGLLSVHQLDVPAVSLCIFCSLRAAERASLSLGSGSGPAFAVLCCRLKPS